jgi:hypothetical protein
MASEVKIALLLGLVFVFAAAFVLNGVPRSDTAIDDNGLKAVMVIDPPGIKPEILPEAFPPDPIQKQPPSQLRPPSDNDEPIRGLPGITSPEEIKKNIEPMEPALSEVYYVVQKSDTLADIAKKFYGPEQGNRRANVLAIFEANRKVLKSPDRIYVGQELVIPRLGGSELDKNKIDSIFPDSMFEEVESIGRRHL